MNSNDKSHLKKIIIWNTKIVIIHLWTIEIKFLGHEF